jgi:hypothetical protein
MKHRTVLTLMIIAALLSGAVSVASAQDTHVLSISPVRFELEAERGKELIEEVELTNAGSRQVTVQTSTNDFVAEGDQGKPRFVPGNQYEWSLSNWIEVEPSSFVLEPGEKKKVQVSIRVPVDAEPGGHYAAVLFSSSPSSSTGTAVVTKIGTLFLLSVPGEIVESGSAALTVPRLWEKGPVSFTVMFKNEGNVHVKPVGTVKVSRLWGRQMAEFAAGGENVLPNSSRQFSAEWQDVPSIGIFSARAELSYGKTGHTTLSPAAYFVVLPWKLVLAGLAIFLFGAAFSVLTGKRKSKRESAV